MVIRVWYDQGKIVADHLGEVQDISVHPDYDKRMRDLKSSVARKQEGSNARKREEGRLAETIRKRQEYAYVKGREAANKIVQSLPRGSVIELYMPENLGMPKDCLLPLIWKEFAKSLRKKAGWQQIKVVMIADVEDRGCCTNTEEEKS